MVAERIAPPQTLWTYDDLLRENTEIPTELWDGEIHEMTSPLLQHQNVVFRLAYRLETWVLNGNGGKVFVSPIDLFLSSRRVFVPDVCFYRRERWESDERIVHEDERRLIAPPDVIIEVLSPSTARTDRVLKMSAYAEFGVAHYWLLDPTLQSFEAFVLDKGRYALEGALAESGEFAPANFPELKFDLSALFAA